MKEFIVANGLQVAFSKFTQERMDLSDQSRLSQSRMYWQGQFPNRVSMNEIKEPTFSEELYLIYMAIALLVDDDKDLLKLRNRLRASTVEH